MSVSVRPRAAQRCAKSGRLFICHNASSLPLRGAPDAQTCWGARTRHGSYTYLSARPPSLRFDLYQSPCRRHAPACQWAEPPYRMGDAHSDYRGQVASGAFASMLTGLSGRPLLTKALSLELLQACTPFIFIFISCGKQTPQKQPELLAKAP